MNKTSFGTFLFFCTKLDFIGLYWTILDYPVTFEFFIESAVDIVLSFLGDLLNFYGLYFCHLASSLWKWRHMDL